MTYLDTHPVLHVIVLALGAIFSGVAGYCISYGIYRVVCVIANAEVYRTGD